MQRRKYSREFKLKAVKLIGERGARGLAQRLSCLACSSAIDAHGE